MAPYPFRAMVDGLSKLEQTSKRLELTTLLSSLFKSVGADELPYVVYLIQGKIYPDYKGVELGIAEKLVIRALKMVTGLDEMTIEKEIGKKGDLGIVAESLISKKKQAALLYQPLTIGRVYVTLDRMAKLSGAGSQSQKLSLFINLLNDCEPIEAKYLIRMAIGSLRLGVADYTVLDALAEAFLGSRDMRGSLETAYNVSGDLGLVAGNLVNGGLESVKKIGVELNRPIRPMLAERAKDIPEALKHMQNDFICEYKYDGERVQIHKEGELISIFSRRLENITVNYPDLVAISKKKIKPDVAIVEGEAVAIDKNSGQFYPFQELMHRRRKYEIDKAMAKYPVCLFLFDIMYLKGKSTLNLPLKERRELLRGSIEVGKMIKLTESLRSSELPRIERMMEDAIENGCEGIMIKDLKSVYRAGAREFSWIKIKREYKNELNDTMDLVVVGAFHGMGRRAGNYGTLLVAAYDEDADTFKTVTKIGTGFKDEDLDMFPKLLSKYVIDHRSARVDSNLKPDVWFEPSVVIEVQAQEITLSPIHTAGLDVVKKGSGLALRFPKFTGKVRDDKSAVDATTVKELVEMYYSQRKIRTG